MPTIREEVPEDSGPPPPAPQEGDELTPEEEAEARKSPLGLLSPPDPDPSQEYDIGLRPSGDNLDLDSILGSDDGRLPGGKFI